MQRVALPALLLLLALAGCGAGAGVEPGECPPSASCAQAGASVYPKKTRGALRPTLSWTSGFARSEVTNGTLTGPADSPCRGTVQLQLRAGRANRLSPRRYGGRRTWCPGRYTGSVKVPGTAPLGFVFTAASPARTAVVAHAAAFFVALRQHRQLPLAPVLRSEVERGSAAEQADVEAFASASGVSAALVPRGGELCLVAATASAAAQTGCLTMRAVDGGAVLALTLPGSGGQTLLVAAMTDLNREVLRNRRGVRPRYSASRHLAVRSDGLFATSLRPGTQLSYYNRRGFLVRLAPSES